MKNFIVVVFLIFVGKLHAQDVSGLANEPVATEIDKHVPADRLLKKEDFKLEEGRMIASNRKCQISFNDTTSKVLVSVICQQKAFKEAGIETINRIILAANEKIGSSVSTYKPSEIKMAYNPELKSWSLTNLYSAPNENGSMKSSLVSLDFDASGNFLDMKRVF